MAIHYKKIVNKNYPFGTPGARIFPQRVVILLLSACSVFSTQAVRKSTESFDGDGGSVRSTSQSVDKDNENKDQGAGESVGFDGQFPRGYGNVSCPDETLSEEDSLLEGNAASLGEAAESVNKDNEGYDASLWKADTLLGWHAALLGWNNVLVGWNDTLLGWNDALVAWNDVLLRWNDAFLGWHDALVAWNDALVGLKDALVRWKDALVRWNNALVAWNDRLLFKNDQLVNKTAESVREGPDEFTGGTAESVGKAHKNDLVAEVSNKRKRRRDLVCQSAKVVVTPDGPRLQARTGHQGLSSVQCSSERIKHPDGNRKQDIEIPTELWNEFCKIRKPHGCKDFCEYLIQQPNLNVPAVLNAILLRMFQYQDSFWKDRASLRQLCLKLRSVLALKPDICQVNNEGQTVLHLAARMQNRELMQMFLMLLPADRKEKEKVLNKEDQGGNTPLHYYFGPKKRSLWLWLVFVYHGADLNVKNKREKTPKNLAKSYHKTYAQNQLLGQAEHFYRNKDQDPEAFRELCDKLGKIDQYSLERSYAECYQHVISKKVDIEQADEEGTILHKILKRMLEEMSRKNIFQNLLLAVKWLLSFNPDVTRANHEGQTPFHLAARMKNKELMQMFLMLLPADRKEKEKVLNKKDQEGNTALHYCVREEPNSDQNGYMEEPNSDQNGYMGDMIIMLLRYHGADVGIRNTNGATPQDWIKSDHLNYQVLCQPLQTICIKKNYHNPKKRRNARRLKM